MEKINNHLYKYYSINQNFFNSIVNNELFFSNPRNFNDPFDSLPRFQICNDLKKLEKFYLFIRTYINEKTDYIENIKDYQKTKLDFKKLLQVFLDVLKKFDESYNVDISNFEYKLIEIFTFYNDINYFNKSYQIDPVGLQKKCI